VKDPYTIDKGALITPKLVISRNTDVIHDYNHLQFKEKGKLGF